MSVKKFQQFTDAQRRAAVVDEPAAVKRPGGKFGPWRPGVEEAERRAGLRALAALTLVFASATHPVVATLRLAERVPEMMGQALDEFDGLPALRRRHIVASYARLMRPLVDGGAP
jgi:hypothetical protein